MPEHEITGEHRQTLMRTYDDLRSLADHPTPVVRAGTRLALAEIAQVLNALGLRYELYSNSLSDGSGEQ